MQRNMDYARGAEIAGPDTKTSRLLGLTLEVLGSKETVGSFPEAKSVTEGGILWKQLK
jgi:hypothetical protein